MHLLPINWRRAGAALLLGATAASAQAATFNVTDAAGLIAAINTANANSEADVIDLGGNTITLTALNNTTDGLNGNGNGLPSITAGGGQLTIRNGTIERSAAATAFRLLHVSAAGNLRLEQLTLRGGSGFLNGAAIFSRGTLYLSRCTVTGNLALAAGGGGLYIQTGTATVANSTISGNTASDGGGINVNSFLDNGSPHLLLLNSTVTQNSGGGGAGGLLTNNTGKMTLVNSIVSGNTSTTASRNEAKFLSGPIVANAYNIFGYSGVANTDGLTPGITDIVPTGALSTILGPLANNGGPTQTHALVAGSPAIDAAGRLCSATDQRGTSRPRGGACDIGAFELAPPTTITVNSLADPGNGTCDATECTLRDAIAAANANANLDQIAFSVPLPGTITLTAGEIAITQPLAINGPGQRQLTIDAQNNSRIFNASAALELRGLTLTRGQVGNGSQGGAVRATTDLTLSGVTISNSAAGVSGQFGQNAGGGVAAQGGHLIIADSTLSSNAALGGFSYGGGVGALGASTATVNRSLFFNNRADRYSGAIFLPDGDGKTAMLNDSAFVNNQSATGGAITLGLDLAATLTNVTFAGNTAGDGAAIDTGGRGSLSLRNTTIVGAGARQLGTGFAISAENSLINSGAAPACNFGTDSLRGRTLIITGSNNQTTDASCVGPTVQTAAALNLGPLGYYGGPTPSVPLLRAGDGLGTGVNSVALDAALACVSGVFADQRGVSRPQGSACDIGAFEREATGSLILDFGDAPMATQSNFTGSYPTTLAQNGAAHLVVAGGPYLGRTAPDSEADGQPAASANGDDSAGTADEDGISGPITLTTGSTGSIAVTVNGSGFLSAWVDLNRDGDWDDAGEQIANDQAVATGTTTLSLAVPANASVGGSFLRLRICSTAGQCNTTTGIAADGEVEDHAITIALPQYTVTASASPSANGTFSCTSPINSGSTSTCNASANPGYYQSAITDNCGAAGVANGSGTGNSYTTGPISANCTVTATFTPAPAGSYVASAGATSATQCLPGFYQPNTGQSNCIPAAINNYVDTAGATSQTACPVGTNQPSTGQTSCIANTYTIATTANPTAGGSVLCTPNPVIHGSNATCSVTLNPGYTLGSFSGDCSGATCSLSNVTVAKSVTVNFLRTTISGPTSTNTGIATAVLSGGGNSCQFTNGNFTAAQVALPAGVSLPHGVFDFTAGTCTGAISVAITYPQPIPAGAQYWKYGKEAANPNPHWYRLPAGQVSINGSTVTISITDNGVGDDDSTAGVIKDPGGIALIDTGAGAANIPTLSEYALMALASLILLLGLRQATRQSGRGPWM